MLFVQGRPTEASVEAKIKDYGELEAKDYIPGAEVLEVEGEPKDEDEEDEGGQKMWSGEENPVLHTCSVQGDVNVNILALANCVLWPPDGWESASDEDEDGGDDGEWVDVHHSSDEDTGEVVRDLRIRAVPTGRRIAVS